MEKKKDMTKSIGRNMHKKYKQLELILVPISEA